jgi:hypothetical protein
LVKGESRATISGVFGGCAFGDGGYALGVER